jgi:hypothetical protein
MARVTLAPPPLAPSAARRVTHPFVGAERLVRPLKLLAHGEVGAACLHALVEVDPVLPAVLCLCPRTHTHGRTDGRVRSMCAAQLQKGGGGGGARVHTWFVLGKRASNCGVCSLTVSAVMVQEGGLSLTRVANVGMNGFMLGSGRAGWMWPDPRQTTALCVCMARTFIDAPRPPSAGSCGRSRLLLLQTVRRWPYHRQPPHPLRPPLLARARPRAPQRQGPAPVKGRQVQAQSWTRASGRPALLPREQARAKGQTMAQCWARTSARVGLASQAWPRRWRTRGRWRYCRPPREQRAWAPRGSQGNPAEQRRPRARSAGPRAPAPPVPHAPTVPLGRQPARSDACALHHAGALGTIGGHTAAGPRPASVRAVGLWRRRCLSLSRCRRCRRCLSLRRCRRCRRCYCCCRLRLGVAHAPLLLLLLLPLDLGPLAAQAKLARLEVPPSACVRERARQSYTLINISTYLREWVPLRGHERVKLGDLRRRPALIIFTVLACLVLVPQRLERLDPPPHLVCGPAPPPLSGPGYPNCTAGDCLHTPSVSCARRSCSSSGAA